MLFIITIITFTAVLYADNILSITSFRHPVNRVISLYWYEHVDYFVNVKKSPRSCYPFVDWVNAWLDGADYKNAIETNYPGNNYIEIENYYVKALIGWQGGKVEQRSLNEQDYLKACEMLEKFDIILVSEWLAFGNQSDFLNAIHSQATRKLGTFLKGKNQLLKATYPHLAHKESIAISLLYERNKYDIMLYEFAKSLIIHRKQSIKTSVSTGTTQSCPKTNFEYKHNPRLNYEERIIRPIGHKGPSKIPQP